MSQHQSHNVSMFVCMLYTRHLRQTCDIYVTCATYATQSIELSIEPSVQVLHAPCGISAHAREQLHDLLILAGRQLLLAPIGSLTNAPNFEPAGACRLRGQALWRWHARACARTCTDTQMGVAQNCTNARMCTHARAHARTRAHACVNTDSQVCFARCTQTRCTCLCTCRHTTHRSV